MSFLDKLAKMVGVRGDQVEDALQDEERARQAVMLSRRGFFAAGATMAAAPLVPKRAYSFLFPVAPQWEMWKVMVGYTAINGLAVAGLLRNAAWTRIDP